MSDDITHEQMRQYVLWEARKLMQQGKWVVVDVETSGLKQPYIVQWAVCAPGGEVLGEGLCRPAPYVRISKEATEKHGLTRHQLRRAPTFDLVAPQIAALIAGKTFIAFNSEFEQRALLTSIYPYRQCEWYDPIHKQFWNLRMECAMQWFAVLNGERGYNGSYRYKSLEVACAHFAIQQERAHQAASDARATATLVQKIAALADQELPPDFDPFEETH